MQTSLFSSIDHSYRHDAANDASFKGKFADTLKHRVQQLWNFATKE